MLKILVVISLFAYCLTAPVEPETKILRYDFEDYLTEGGYKFIYETSDQQKRQEEGKIVPINDEVSDLVIQGSYSYVGPDGVTYTVEYTADQNGFHASGAHLP